MASRTARARAPGRRRALPGRPRSADRDLHQLGAARLRAARPRVRHRARLHVRRARSAGHLRLVFHRRADDARRSAAARMSEAAQPLRVLLVSANYKPSVGGIEQYVDNLAHGLAGRGHWVTVAACRTDGGAMDEQDGGVRIIRIPATDVLHKRLNVPYPLPNPVAALHELRGAVAEADVVHVHDALYATSVLSLALARRARVAAVLTQHV